MPWKWQFSCRGENTMAISITTLWHTMKVAVFMPWRKHRGNFHHWQRGRRKKEMRYFKFYSSKYRIIYIYCIFIYVCMHACMYVCMYNIICIYICVYIYMYMYMPT
jgi:hypothetical protein